MIRKSLHSLIGFISVLGFSLMSSRGEPEPLSDVLPGLPASQRWTLLWGDEFDGASLDPAKWEVLGDWKRRDGFWVKDDSYLDQKGNLVLRTKKDGDRFTSGAVRTRNRFEQAFGYWVIRCQLPKQPGHWPAFWLMSDGVTKVGDEGRDGTEIDIVEIPWRNGQITMNLHWDGYGKELKSAGKRLTIPELTTGFHTFGLLWTTNEYAFYTDGKETWRSSAGGVSQVPEFIKLTEEIGKWAGDIQKGALPDYFLVDYVRVYVAEPATVGGAMHAGRSEATGQIEITENQQPVLRYNYYTVSPGDRLARINAENQKYARPRSDYIHPLYGLEGEELTSDWPVDHPHHRGIYWAWPEVTFGSELGDLHALQRVFARPTGRVRCESGSITAVVEAENVWLWEDREAIVHERAIIRAYRKSERGRYIDLEFRLRALRDNVSIARRGTDKYGGLNIRLAPVGNQLISAWTGPATTEFPVSWAELSGNWPGAKGPGSLLVLQKKSNPDYPGDWVKFPELNWVQPTFPAAGTRFELRKDEPLVLNFRLWIQSGAALQEAIKSELWQEYNRDLPR